MIEASPITLERCTVPASWVDQNGHMNVAYYATAFDRALEAFFELAGFGRAYVAGNRAAMFVVETHFTYQHELMADDPLEIRFQLLDRDRKRIHCFMELYHQKDGFLAATSEQIAVHVDLTTRKSMTIPPPQLDKLTAYLEAHRRIARPKEVGHKIGIRRRRLAPTVAAG